MGMASRQHPSSRSTSRRRRRVCCLRVTASAATPAQRYAPIAPSNLSKLIKNELSGAPRRARGRRVYRRAAQGRRTDKGSMKCLVECSVECFIECFMQASCITEWAYSAADAHVRFVHAAPALGELEFDLSYGVGAATTPKQALAAYGEAPAYVDVSSYVGLTTTYHATVRHSAKTAGPSPRPPPTVSPTTPAPHPHPVTPPPNPPTPPPRPSPAPTRNMTTPHPTTHKPTTRTPTTPVPCICLYTCLHTWLCACLCTCLYTC